MECKHIERKAVNAVLQMHDPSEQEMKAVKHEVENFEKLALYLLGLFLTTQWVLILLILIWMGNWIFL